MHAGRPDSGPRTFWTVDATLRAAGFRTRPYCATGPLAGFAHGAGRSGRAAAVPRGSGFLLAAVGWAPQLGLASSAPRLRALDASGLAAGAWCAERTRLPDLPPSTLLHPRYTD